VAGCGRSAADSVGARAFISSVEAEGREAFYQSADVADREVPEALIGNAANSLGGIDVVVSNAGRNIFKGAADATNADWDECMELDLAAHWRLAKAARPHLARSPGAAIVIIGSNHAWNSIPGCFPYNVAKAGLLGLVQSLAIEWGPAIRTVGIAPGFIDTAGNQQWFDGFPDPAAERARTGRMHPVGRIGTVEEIGALCAFLASPHAGFISGTTLCVDGGRSAIMQDR
jgi:NAD(P)-dependent dehydrogenase (short-subunit alcohol dehydrogenase family)